jgi:hypothetical protein
MKKIKRITLVGLILACILYSCSMEKRVYMSGYHVEWKNANRNNHKLAGNKNEKKTKEDKATVKQSKVDTDVVDDSTPINGDMSSSAGNSVTRSLYKIDSFSLKDSVKKSANETNVTSAPSKLKSNDHKKIKKNKRHSPDDEGDNKILATIALVLGILGCVGYFAGPLFALAGIVVSVIALGQIKKDPQEYGGKKMATVGLALSIISLVVWTLIIVLYIAILTGL